MYQHDAQVPEPQTEQLTKEDIAKAVEERLLKSLERLLAKPEKGYFTFKEAAIFVSCSECHIRRHVTGGTIDVSNIGTNDGPDYRISRGDLVAWMDERKA